MTSRILITLIVSACALAFAQIGEAPETLLSTLGASYEVVPQAEGYSVNDVRFSFDERGGALYRLEGEGTLDETGTDTLSSLIAAATPYGTQLKDSLTDFFGGNVEQLVGQGRQTLPVAEYALDIEVLNDSPPYSVSFSLGFQELDTALFPEARHSLGPEDATYVIREFSDFQCPFCSQFVSTALPYIKETLLARGDVRFEYHHFPLRSIHANAQPAAEAAECVTAANTPDAFWPYHDALFERQQAWQSLGSTDDYFVRLAQDLGLSTEGVAACIENRSFADEVDADYQTAAQTLGISSTPTVFVNGFRVSDYRNVDNFTALIGLLEKFSQTP